MARFKPE